jgi:hypothetical protein
MEENHKK